MKYGFIYCMGNKSMPGVYKVGMTTRAPMLRLEELSGSTSAPESFFIMAYAEVINPRETEGEIHELLEGMRVSQNREFFKGDIYEIFQAMKARAITYTETLDGSTQAEYEDVMYTTFDTAEQIICDGIIREAKERFGLERVEIQTRGKIHIVYQKKPDLWFLLAANRYRDAMLRWVERHIGQVVHGVHVGAESAPAEEAGACN